MNEVGIIVLAAGASARMGRPKQLLRLGGKSMLRNACTAAVDCGAEGVVVVLGAHADRMSSELEGIDATVVVNPRWDRGVGSSIRCGLAFLLEARPLLEWACITLCDAPFVSCGVLRRLMSARLQANRPIIVSQAAEKTGPPVLFHRDYFSSLSALPEESAARDIWADRLEDVHFEPCPEAGVDIDTPGDYMRLMRSCDWFPADAVALSRGILAS